MKLQRGSYFSLPLLLLVSSVGGATSSHLRSSTVRRLEDNSTDSSNSEMIQAKLSDALPDINFDMRKALEDPLNLNLDQAVPLPCGNLALTMDFEKLTGLSTINVNSITLQDGSDSIMKNCNILEAWRTAADVAVTFGSNLASGNVRSRVVGTCNGVTYDQPLTTSVIATGVGYNGVANLKGTFGPVVDTINDAEILGTLALTTSSIAASVSLLPDALAAYLPTITSQLEAALRNQLVQVVEPEVRRQLERTIPSTRLFTVVNNVLGDAAPVLSHLFGSWLGGGGE